MKKSLVAALTGALVVGATATTFAAANPFSDVPAGHWAYDSVTRLAGEGIIEGYGDGTYRGNRNITRYEMAQMIARAMAKTPRANMSAASRADLDTLAAEFRDELDNLGVRVEELEKNADKVKWTGKVEYTYNHHKYRGNTGIKQNGDGSFGPYRSLSDRSGHDGLFRLEPTAELNEHWTAHARFDAGFNLQDDSTNDVFLKRAYVEGDYDKFNVKLGRFGFCPSIEDGIVADTNMSGIQLGFGSKWKFNVSYGRIGGGDEPEYATHKDGFNTYDGSLGTYRHISRNGGTADDPTDMVALNVRYEPGEKGLYGGASYYYAKDDDFAAYKNGASDNDKASIWAVGLGYKFNDMLDLHGSYGRNGKADFQKDGWAVDLRYGRYGDYAEKGDWAVWAGYAKFGEGAGIVSNQGDDIATGEKGWHVGAAYAPFRNVGVLVRYADAKILDTNVKDKHFWARAEFFF